MGTCSVKARFESVMNKWRASEWTEVGTSLTITGVGSAAVVIFFEKRSILTLRGWLFFGEMEKYCNGNARGGGGMYL